MQFTYCFFRHCQLYTCYLSIRWTDPLDGALIGMSKHTSSVCLVMDGVECALASDKGLGVALGYKVDNTKVDSLLPSNMISATVLVSFCLNTIRSNVIEQHITPRRCVLLND